MTKVVGNVSTAVHPYHDDIYKRHNSANYSRDWRQPIALPTAIDFTSDGGAAWRGGNIGSTPHQLGRLWGAGMGGRGWVLEQGGIRLSDYISLSYEIAQAPARDFGAKAVMVNGNSMLTE